MKRINKDEMSQMMIIALSQLKKITQVFQVKKVF